jgi:hypothetical protein
MPIRLDANVNRLTRVRVYRKDWFNDTLMRWQTTSPSPEMNGVCSENLAPAVRKNSILHKMCRMGTGHTAVGGLEVRLPTSRRLLLATTATPRCSPPGGRRSKLYHDPGGVPVQDELRVCHPEVHRGLPPLRRRWCRTLSRCLRDIDFAKRRSASWLPPQCNSFRDGQGREGDDDQKEEGQRHGLEERDQQRHVVLPAQRSAVASRSTGHIRYRPGRRAANWASGRPTCRRRPLWRYFGDAGLGAAFTMTVPFIQACSVQ